jgi:hypothetical protein
MAVITLALCLLLFGLLTQAPIAQFADYHDLADQRRLLGIPHFWNVASNLPFLIVGVMGLVLLRRRPAGASPAWAAVFGGTLLVFFGSAYYHLDPRDATLVWDRLPIGIAFMGFSVALICEHTGENGKRIAQRMLLPLILFSIGAVYWWRFTGDLSLWVWVQLAPMLAIPLALIFLPAQYTHRRYLLYALGCYALAKGFELGDRQLMEWSSGVLSGHSLKHVAAAAGVLCFYAMLKKRMAVC